MYKIQKKTHLSSLTEKLKNRHAIRRIRNGCNQTEIEARRKKSRASKTGKIAFNATISTIQLVACYVLNCHINSVELATKLLVVLTKTFHSLSIQIKLNQFK